MPSKTSAEKRQRQSEKHRFRNKTAKSRVKTEIKKYLQTIEQKDAVQAESQYRYVTSLIDTAAGKGIYHKNNAARKKSRLFVHLQKLKSGETGQ